MHVPKSHGADLPRFVMATLAYQTPVRINHYQLPPPPVCPPMYLSTVSLCLSWATCTTPDPLLPQVLSHTNSILPTSMPSPPYHAGWQNQKPVLDGPERPKNMLTGSRFEPPTSERASQLAITTNSPTYTNYNSSSPFDRSINRSLAIQPLYS